MVAKCPNAGAVGNHNRRAVIRRPRDGVFVSIVAHGITPIDVAADCLKKCPHYVSPRAADERLLARLALLWLAYRSYR